MIFILLLTIPLTLMRLTVPEEKEVARLEWLKAAGMV